MRNELTEIAYGDWRTLVVRVRAATRLKTGRLAAMADVSSETWWRWENKGQRPKEAAVVERFASAFHVDPDLAMWAAGLAIEQKEAVAGPDLTGLDPNDPVVKHILTLDIDDEELGYMLDRRREILALREKQDLRELQLQVRRGSKPDEPTAS